MRYGRSARMASTVIVGLALLLAACSAGGAPTATPGTAAPSTAVMPSLIGPTPPPASRDPIAEGTYRSQPIPVTLIVARINADTTLTDTQRTAALQGFSGHTTQTITLDFRAGQFTESEAFDGAPSEVGARATYAFPDDHTLVIQETCCGLSTFTITPTPGGFSLMYKAGAPNAGEDAIGRAAIYEIGPFTRVP